MTFDRRQYLNQKFHQRGLFFYGFSVGIFAIIAFITFLSILVYGITEQRLALIFLNLWFCLFTMDLVVTKLRRFGEKAPWHEWACFNNNQSEEPHTEKQIHAKS